MNTYTQSNAYETPRLEVKQLRDLPSALATSGRNCHGSHGSVSNNNNNNNNNHNNNNHM
ncbi:MAG TPA: hypothetical protein VFU49_13075 [Ktedonobacteraceae bacterium]|nr:hypothetical protein [Ktedonobacteraceae bacterium]